MIEYDLKKNNNKKNVKAYGKYYAKPHISETVDLDELADHMHGHNSPFSAGTIKGILIDAVTHIKELLLRCKALHQNTYDRIRTWIPTSRDNAYLASLLAVFHLLGTVVEDRKSVV